MKPYCFVLMPYGRKPDESGTPIDFDDVYHSMIEPAVRDADLDPIRADEELVGGSIHKPLFERLMLCDYAVADLTTASPNVLYELGVRHAVRPWSTTIVFRDGTRLPFDLAPLRAIPYRLEALASGRHDLARRLQACRDRHDDSPVYQFLTNLPRPVLSHEATDVFRDRVEYARGVKQQLTHARRLGAEAGRLAIKQIRDSLGTLSDVETGILIDVLLSFRTVGAFEDLVTLYGELPDPLRRDRLVRELVGFALNRLGRSSEAEQILLEVIRDGGPSPETNGLLGRIYKDRAGRAAATKDEVRARGLYRKAIETYVAGFECDWRDCYPGINALTLMHQLDPIDPRFAPLLPVVRYAAERRVASGHRGYWELATLLEIAALAGDAAAALNYLEDVLPAAEALGDTFAPASTADNLSLIRAACQRRGQDMPWLSDAIAQLRSAAQRLERGQL